MRDISFRDVLDALDQQRVLVASPPLPPALTATATSHDEDSSSDRSRATNPHLHPLSSSPTSLAMALLATACSATTTTRNSSSSSIVSSPETVALRPIAIRPKNYHYEFAAVANKYPVDPLVDPQSDHTNGLLHVVPRLSQVRLAPRPASLPSSSANDAPSAVAPGAGGAVESDSSTDKQVAAGPLLTARRRKARVCRTPGCEKYVVDRGLCIAHGGGKRCTVEDCECRAQNRGLCWKHGGFTICTVDGCTKRAKSRGICWTHGGGTKCKTEECEKIAVSHGRCWAHGGGKRCSVTGCKKPASERMDNCCADHFDPSRSSSDQAR